MGDGGNDGVLQPVVAPHPGKKGHSSQPGGALHLHPQRGNAALRLGGDDSAARGPQGGGDGGANLRLLLLASGVDGPRHLERERKAKLPHRRRRLRKVEGAGHAAVLGASILAHVAWRARAEKAKVLLGLVFAARRPRTARKAEGQLGAERPIELPARGRVAVQNALVLLVGLVELGRLAVRPDAGADGQADLQQLGGRAARRARLEADVVLLSIHRQARAARHAAVIGVTCGRDGLVFAVVQRDWCQAE